MKLKKLRKIKKMCKETECPDCNYHKEPDSYACKYGKHSNHKLYEKYKCLPMDWNLPKKNKTVIWEIENVPIHEMQPCVIIPGFGNWDMKTEEEKKIEELRKIKNDCFSVGPCVRCEHNRNNNTENQFCYMNEKYNKNHKYGNVSSPAYWNLSLQEKPGCTTKEAIEAFQKATQPLKGSYEDHLIKTINAAYDHFQGLITPKLIQCKNCTMWGPEEQNHGKYKGWKICTFIDCFMAPYCGCLHGKEK